METEDLRERLRKKVLGPEGQGSRAVFLEEVPAATGYGDGRRLDAVSIGMWPSRGCLLEGYELKVSRADWLGELKEPAKAEALARFCDRFWLVLGGDGIVEPGEVPAPWGILRAKGRGLTCDREATPMTPEERPATFIASLLRRAVRADLNRELRLARKTAQEEAAHRSKDEIRTFERRVAELADQLEAYESQWTRFEEIAGVTFPRFMRNREAVIAKVGRVASTLLSAKGREDPAAEVDVALARLDRARDSLLSAQKELAAIDAEKEVVSHG